MNLAATTPPNQIAAYLRTLPAIRERCTRVFDLAKEGKLEYFEYHPEKERDVAAFCVDIIKIPPHGRWRHLDAGRPRIAPLIAQWKASPLPPNDTEIAKRLIDLFMVAVLLDAGAGNKWTYTEAESGLQFSRSEGLGVAAFHMFMQGLFSGDPNKPYQVDAEGLARLTVEKISAGMQVTPDNPLVGLEGRTSLLVNLSTALRTSPEFFGSAARPGGVVDFLSSQSLVSSGTHHVPVAALWHALIAGLQPIWPPSRTSLAGLSLGDVWPCSALSQSPAPGPSDGATFVPFHKLTGWLTYSLIEPLSKILGWHFDGVEDMTGLPEYRNGGLFVDLGVLSLKPNPPEKLGVDAVSGVPRVPPTHPAIIEWRALTVILLQRPHSRCHPRSPSPPPTSASRKFSKALPGKAGVRSPKPCADLLVDLQSRLRATERCFEASSTTDSFLRPSLFS
ncbi:hypothetical protein MIND_01098300 [Mycena indigotica]|uniref:DUF1688-domain-containing protein n=1 Tax=Mycena indigotica TaxID=2126181 RepID=A0A8H6SAY4_9AGAR|nr:uncharacterized protein MIND_01098300 [Mycena indigotica]KAF7295583.1 hypothetical protein MIND_01098300 [Mycena indigotica]